MARGYPEPKNKAPLAPPLLVDPRVCYICKHRPASSSGGMCPTCDEALHG